MRRTKHRRRFHTERVIANRRRLGEKLLWEDEWFVRHPPEDGRLHDRFYYRGCGNARCFLCHFDKLIGDRRTREKRLWMLEAEEQLDCASAKSSGRV